MEAARVSGRTRVARIAGTAVATLLLSIGPFNAIRDATSNAIFADLWCCSD